MRKTEKSTYTISTQHCGNVTSHCRPAQPADSTGEME